MTEKPKILVIRLREIGDTILLTPMLRQLKRLHPASTLDVVCEDRNSAVLRHNPHVDKLIPLPRKASVWRFLQFANRLWRENYDLVVDSQAMPKTAVLARFTNARRRLGFKYPWLRDRLCYTAPYLRSRAQYTAVSNLELLQDDRVDFTDLRLEVPTDKTSEHASEPIVRIAAGRAIVAINPATRFEERRWTYEGYALIADRLSKKGFLPLILYGPGEREAAENVAQRMTEPCLIDYATPSFLELGCILSKCELYVGNDGGPKHLAIASGVSTVTVFGHSPDPWTPWANPKHRVIASAKTGHAIQSCGEVILEAPSIQAIPVERVWRQVEIALGLQKQAA